MTYTCSNHFVHPVDGHLYCARSFGHPGKHTDEHGKRTWL